MIIQIQTFVSIWVWIYYNKLLEIHRIPKCNKHTFLAIFTAFRTIKGTHFGWSLQSLHLHSEPSIIPKVQGKISQFFWIFYSFNNSNIQMEPIETVKQMLIWLCVCPSPKSASKSAKLAHLAFTVFVFSGNIGGAITHGFFLFKFGATDLKGSIFSFMGSTGFSAILYVMIILSSMGHQITSILGQLSIIYKTRKKSSLGKWHHFEIYLNWTFSDENSNTFEFLRRANDTSEWICKFYIKYVMYFVLGGNITLANISALIGFITGHFEASQAFHISRFWWVGSDGFAINSINQFEFRSFVVYHGTHRLFWGMPLSKISFAIVDQCSWR